MTIQLSQTNECASVASKSDVHCLKQASNGCLTESVIVQTGFGWSNGVVLSLLHKYGWPADEPMFCPEPSR